MKKTPRTQKKSVKDPALALVQSTYQAANDTKAKDLLILDLHKKATYTDYLLIGSGTSHRQVTAIADRIEEMVRKKFQKIPLGVEGKEHGVWVLLDYGDVVCHVFLDEVRAFYRLEHLWHDAKRVDPERPLGSRPKGRGMGGVERVKM